jgi:hypothetical protein
MERTGIELRSSAARPARALFFVLFVFIGTVAPFGAEAEEMTIQNDSVTNFSQVAIQAGFAGQEEAATWLTSTCTGDLVAVQVFWASVSGGAPDEIGDSVKIRAPGAFPTPGTLLVNLPGPLMNDGFLNEFRYVDEAQTVPLVLPVTVGEVVVVSFKFDIAPNPPGPSVVTDIDGCQAGKNSIFAIPPSSWFSACTLGLSGDFVIRAVVDCDPTIFVDGFESGDVTAWSVVEPLTLRP